MGIDKWKISAKLPGLCHPVIVQSYSATMKYMHLFESFMIDVAEKFWQLPV